MRWAVASLSPRGVVLGLVLGLAGAGVACDREPSPSRGVTTRPIDRTDLQLSEELLVALAQAKNFHHQADVHLADGNPRAAIAAVTRILALPFPAAAAEGDDTLLDARARLAKLHLGLGQLGEARRVVEEGLAAPPRESFFLANLYTVAGEVHEAIARSLDGADPAAARRERQAALAAYDRSIQINESIQKRLYKEARP